MPHDDTAVYDQAPPLERETAWLSDPARVHRRGPRLRGTGTDSPAREFALRRAAAADRAALADPSAASAAEEAADRLWFEDGWDENWEGLSRRGYVRRAYGRWLAATGAQNAVQGPSGATGSTPP